jgi:hypothetical protein
MNRIALLLFALFLTEGLFAQAFRNVNWGASIEEVKASEEKKPYLENEETLVYKVQLAGKEVLLLYNFLPKHGLYSSGYIFEEKHTNKNEYIADYNEVKSLLTKKYGATISDKVIWSNDLYKDDPQYYGTAVSVGHLKYGSYWTVEGTDIRLGLLGDNFEISMILNYESLKLKKLAEEAEELKKLKDF